MSTHYASTIILPVHCISCPIDGLHLTSRRPCWRYNTKEYIISCIVGSSRRGWLTLESLSKGRFCQHGRQPEVSCVVIDGECCVSRSRLKSTTAVSQLVNFHVHEFKRERLAPSFAIYNDASYFRLPSVLTKTSLAE